MKEFTTSERLKTLMKERNLRQVDILKLAEPYCKKYNIKLGKNEISQYVSGKVEPRQDKLSLLGMSLNVSEAWLMGFDVPMSRNSPNSSSIEQDIKVKEFVELFTKLTPQEQTMLLQQINGILSSRE